MQIPDLRQLRYFIAVAEELHFSRAAKRLNIAQPPLTQQIQALERTLGVSLFVRSTRRVELTPAGTAFLEGARRALAEAARASEVARRAGRGEFETLRVGFSDAAAMNVLPGAVTRFKQSNPGVHLDLHEHVGAGPLDDAVRRDVIDIAITRGPISDIGLHVQTILEEPFWVALPEKHPLASRRRVSVRSLRGVPLIFFPRRISAAYYDHLVEVCRAAGFTPEIAYEVEKYVTILALIAAGVGVGIIPRANKSLSRSGVVYRPLTGSSLTAVVVAAFRTDRTSVALDAFLDALVKAASALSNSAQG